MPADPAYVPMTTKGVEIFSLKRGFDGKTAGQIALAVEEAMLNAFEMGYDGMDEEIDIRISSTSTGIEITVLSMGLPLHPEHLPQYSLEKVGTRFDAGGLSFFLVKQLMDEVSFSTCINGERRLSLIKRLPLPVVALDKHRIQDKTGRKEDKALDLSYQIRQARPEDAEDISRLVFRAHGKMLFSEDIYYPARVEEMLLSGKMVSYVAVMGEDEIVGHGALLPMDSEGQIREMTYGVVNPEFRSRGTMSDFAFALVRHAREQNVFAVMVMSVTDHVHSQKAAARFGLKVCALMVATTAASTKMGKNETPDAGRIANLVQVKYINIDTKPDGLYLPSRHASMLQKLYRHLGKAVESKPVPSPTLELSVGITEIRSDSDLVEGWMVIFVQSFGRDARACVNRFLQEALCQQIPAIQLFLPLDDPFTAQLTPEFEADGFFFSGVAPEEGPRKYLILQYINSPNPGYEDIHVMEGMGEELKNYVIQCSVSLGDSPDGVER